MASHQRTPFPLSAVTFCMTSVKEKPCSDCRVVEDWRWCWRLTYKSPLHAKEISVFQRKEPKQQDGNNGRFSDGPATHFTGTTTSRSSQQKRFKEGIKTKAEGGREAP